MFFLLFGGFWTAISTIILISFAMVPDTPSWVYVMLIGFEAIGLPFLYYGLKIIIRNHKTKKYGKECYGKIISLSHTGTYVNGNAEYKADVLVYLEDSNITEEVTEVVGLNPNKYPINSYVLVKYYEGDINFIKNDISINELSDNARYYLKADSINKRINSDEIITVNGIRYKKIDE